MNYKLAMLKQQRIPNSSLFKFTLERTCRENGGGLVHGRTVAHAGGVSKTETKRDSLGLFTPTIANVREAADQRFVAALAAVLSCCRIHSDLSIPTASAAALIAASSEAVTRNSTRLFLTMSPGFGGRPRDFAMLFSDLLQFVSLRRI